MRISVNVLLTICLFFVSGTAVLRAEFNPNELQAAIDRAGAHWTAAESLLPVEGFPGGVLPPLSSVDCGASENAAGDPRDVPEYFDWRDRDGVNWMTPVKHQGGCGACSAFASLGALEATIRLAYTNSNLDIDLSEQHLFSCAGGDCPTGLYLGDAMDYIQNHGVPDEVCLPYAEVDDNCGDTCANWMDSAETIDGWDLLWQYDVNIDQLKVRIMDQPVACYLEVFGDFMNYSSGVYEHVTGNYRGGHFVVLVGWDDALDCWICKNSWGEGWGENGYFRIKRGETEIGSWAMVQHYTPGSHPTATPVPDTPTPQPSPDITPTATPEYAEGVTLDMPKAQYSGGDTFYLDAVLMNSGEPEDAMSLFACLDIAGNYWFWPGWGAYPPDIDWDTVPFPSGISTVPLIQPFQWPDMDSAGIDACFWAVLMNPELTDMIGTFTKREWEF